MSLVHRWPVVFIVSLAVCAHHFCSSDEESSLVDDGESISEQIDNYLTDLNKNMIFSGSVLVAKDGQIILRKGYGCADYVNEIPNTPETRFHIGSTSKQFTAACIMILQQEGKLKVTDSLSKYFPKLPKTDAMTIHGALSHTAGLRRDPVGAEFLPENTSLDQLVASIEAQPFEEGVVGGTFTYSNCGYFLLSKIIEQISGMPFQQFITERIFEKVGMKDSQFDDHSSLSNKALDYDEREGKVVPLLYDYPTVAEGSGLNLCSTVDDLYKWDRALYTDQILSDESKEQMFTPANKEWYGYGWGIQQRQGRKCIWHNGSVGGYRACIGRYIDDDVCIIILNNIGSHPTGDCPMQTIFTSIGNIVFEYPGK
jgi:CubicO group peptidase (beta-lactamase class C family)